MQGDTFIYTGLQDKQPNYFTLNLKDGTTQILREIDRDGDGSHSRLVIEGNLVVFSEVFKIEGRKDTVVTVHDFETKQSLESYIFPYEFAENILLKGDKIYSSLRKDNEPAVIGFIDRTTGEFQIVETSVGIHDYATDGEHFAIAVQKGDSNTVQLFKLQDGELKPLSKLPSIRERLVLPRFTEQGTLVVNGEGKDKAVYLIRFDKKK